MSDHQSRVAAHISELTKRIEAIALEVSELERRRDANAVDASHDHKGALREIAQIDAQIDALARERRTLSSALTQTEELAQDEQKALLDKQEHQRQREGYEIAATIAMLNEECDAALCHARELLERRQDQINRLSRLHMVEPGLLARMHRDAITAAFAFANLHRFTDMRAPAPTSIRALASANKLLGTIGTKPPGRARLHDGGRGCRMTDDAAMAPI